MRLLIVDGARNAAVAFLALVAVAVSGCSDEVAAPERAGAPSATGDDSGTPGGLRPVEEVTAPDSVPTLVVDGPLPTTVPAAAFDWSALPAGESSVPPAPPPWTPVGAAGSSVSVALSSPNLPEFVVIQEWDAVDSTGLPDETAGRERVCVPAERSGPCRVSTREGFVVVEWDLGSSTRPLFVSLQCTWLAPPDLQRGGPDEVWASWLFSVDDQTSNSAPAPR